MKKVLRVIGYIFVSLIGLFLIGVGILWLYSPGTPDIIVDKNGEEILGAFSAIEKIDVNGTEQYLIMRGVDTTKPIILFLHGGPGAPEYPFFKNKGLEEKFLMVYWQQRGAAKSYANDLLGSEMTVPQLISDADVVASYLRTRFQREKIYLMGHSWGTFLGTLLVHQHPYHFHSYIGIGQVANQYEGERLSFEWLKAQALAAENRSDIEKLTPLKFPEISDGFDTWFEFLSVTRPLVTEYGGGMVRENTSSLDIRKYYFLKTPELTIREKFNIRKGFEFSLKYLFDDVLHANLSDIDSLSIPVHILQGVHDYQTPSETAKDFFDRIKAPEKHFYPFENSGHAPFLAERAKFNETIARIVQ